MSDEPSETDMPQPLSQVKRDCAILLGPHALEREPELAAKVMRVIGEWAHIDATFGAILTNFLKADFIVVNEMLQALIGGTARNAAFNAAARSALGDADYDLVRAVSKIIKPSRERRNQFAHHVWAYTDDIPGAVLLINPSQILGEHVQWRSKQPDPDAWFHTETENGAIKFSVRPPPVADHSQVMVFRKADLERDAEAALRAHALVTRLWTALMNSRESPGARDTLLSQSDVALAIQTLQQQK